MGEPRRGVCWDRVKFLGVPIHLRRSARYQTEVCFVRPVTADSNFANSPPLNNLTGIACRRKLGFGARAVESAWVVVCPDETRVHRTT